MSADYSSDGNFHGHSPRECSEHRTVGSHRAWCFDCGEWCYPDEPCIRCRPRPDAATLRERIWDAVDDVLCAHRPFDAPASPGQITDAVMAVLAEHGLVEREARDGE